MDYTELHLHTHYSLLDGLNSPKEYLERAKEIGMTHMAITDHGVHFGHREFHREALAAGITPILGVEAYISPTDRFDRRSVKKRDDNTQNYNHIGLLAKNAEGLVNLNKLSEIAWTEGFYSKPRIDLEVLEEFNDGIIVLTGCMNGLVSKAIENGQPIKADQYMTELKDIFGDRLFVEIQGHNPPELNSGLIDIAEKHGVLTVVTSDCHYTRKEDLWVEEAMLILSTNPTPAKSFDFSKSQKMDYLERFNYLYPDRKMTFQEIEIYLRSAVEQKELLAQQDIGTQPIENTMIVADMIEQYPYHEGLDLLPRSRTDDPDELLRKKVIAGAKKRGTYGDPVCDARREEELEIIKGLGFAPYFIPLANAVSWAKSKGIRTGVGRGSGAGSQVNYELNITGVPPIPYNLLFFRFLNPERNDDPDIDTDFQGSRRGEVKNYLAKEYKNVASLMTIGTFQGKRAVRDAARVFRVPLGDVNKALKGADWPNNMDWFKEFDKTEKGHDFSRKYPEVITLAKYLHGRVRETGIHAGGVVLSREPLHNYASMFSASHPTDKSAPRIPVVGLDMDEAASLGLVKYDILGLKTLDIIDDALKFIKDRHDIDIDIESLSFDDPNVYKMLSEGWTKAVFQCEQFAYTNLIMDMGGVHTFDELIASNALVRPGAAKSTAGKDYIDRKNGLRGVQYPHPDMEPFTNETYGTVIYQEQVMLTMTELAGMTMAEADKVRKIIGKKRDVSEFDEYKVKFVEGASKKVSHEVAERLWHDFEAHAGYSFNKSHSVAYSMVSYWTAWLKYHYPIEFMAAVLRNELDKDALLDYLMETKRLGIRVKLPHVNTSGVKFEIMSDEKGDYLQFGLSNIKFISDKLAARLIARRPFRSYQELYDTIQEQNNGLNTRILQGLNAIGGASFADNPRTGREQENYYEYLNIPSFGMSTLPPKVVAQFTPLEEFSEKDSFISIGMVRKITTGDNWARVEIVDETGSVGVFTNPNTHIETGQRYIFLIANNSIARYVSVNDFNAGEPNSFVDFLNADGYPDIPHGMYKVIGFRTRITKAGKKMADVTLCDENKNLATALVWPSTYSKAYVKCRDGAVVMIDLKQKDDGTIYVENIL